MTLGADVPACLASVTLRGEGRGDRLVPCANDRLGGTPLLLVNPGVALSTAAVFHGWSGRDGGALDEGEPLAAALAGRNDLETPARAIVPAIGEVLGRLRDAGGILARMSGSGATCFALFDTPAARDAAAAAIAADHPGWWRLATRLR